MDRLRVLAATPEHFKRLSKYGLRFLEYETYNNHTNWRQVGATLISQGACYAGVIGDGDSLRVVAISGVVIERRGVGKAWLLGSMYLPLYWCGITKAVKRQIPAIVEFYNLDRLYASTEKGFDAGEKFLEALGFKWEHDESNYIKRKKHSFFVWEE